MKLGFSAKVSLGIIFHKKPYYSVLHLKIDLLNSGRGDTMLSRDCDGCELQLFECKRRYTKVTKGEKVYCPDGTAHLVDQPIKG